MRLIKNILVTMLIWESRLILRKYKPFIIAITGSVGKTSAKDAIYCVVKDNFKYVRKSEKSMNSEIGLPLTIIGAPNAWRSIGGWIRNIALGFDLIISRSEYPDCLVLEVGADHPGDIRKITKWMRPDISVITRISDTPVHVEFFSSPLEVFKEKSYLAKAVKDNGKLILFADDSKFRELASLVASRNVNVITYGCTDESKIRGSNYSVLYESGIPVGMSFDIDLGGNITKISMNGVLGKSFIYPLLAAAAVGNICDINQDKIIEKLKSYLPPNGRMNIISGMNGSVLIDDTYNSSPDAAESALSMLASLSVKGKKVVALGDMMELGSFTADEHRRIGKIAASSADYIVTVGQRSKTFLADEALKSGIVVDNVRSFDSSIDAAEFIASIVGDGDVVLAKGSQSMRMERVVKRLMKDPSKAQELLVRQEKEWLDKV